MESIQPLDNDFRQELGITGDINGYLSETAKWCKFLSIIGFIMVGLMVILAIFMGTAMQNLSGAFPDSGNALYDPSLFSGMFTFLYLLFALFYFFPTLYLYRFSTEMQTALRTSDQQALTTSFSNLKSVFKFWGIFMIVILGFYAFAFVIGIGSAFL